MTRETPLLDVRRLTKRFPGVLALNSVSLELRPGEVLAVIGENGAGKSTLMKILAGVQIQDSGTIHIDGHEVKLGSVPEALGHGIALIHQELNLSGNLDIGSNIFLGREPRNLGIINKLKIHDDTRTLLERVGLDASPETPADSLPIGHQQLVEIAKALSVNARILIMDEPTSSLSTHESERLFEVIQSLRDQGVGIVYISHRLGEVKRLADRVTVMRDGENAGDLCAGEIEHDRMVNLMVGRDISQFYTRTHHARTDVALGVKGVRTMAYPRHEISFTVNAGEIVGVAGLVGAGRTEFLRVLFGIDPALGGEIRVHGRPVTLNCPQDAIQSGIALVPEDRKLQGLILELAVRHNIGLPGLSKHAHFGFFRNGTSEDRDTVLMIDKLRIKTPHADQISQYLSGGNQQKVVLGKWLALNPSILLLDEPTRGIDIGAKQEIYKLMEELAENGVAVLFVSSEMEEILGMSDRALVVHEGRIAGELERNELSEEAIMQLATGSMVVGHESGK